MNKNPNNIKKPKSMWLLWVVGLALVIGIFAWNWWLYGNYENTNEFGDNFGVASALFTGLAFAALVISIRQQNIDIGNQREDISIQTEALKLQGEELKAQRQEMQEQNLTMKLQRFENTFFNMLNLHHEIVSDIEFIEYPTQRITVTNPRFLSRKAFHEAYIKLLLKRMEGAEGLGDVFDIHSSTIMHFQLGHYYKNLYQILKFVDSFDFNATSFKEDSEIKLIYTEIVRSQLSRYELIWIFYYSLLEIGEGDLRPLIKKYSMFINLSKYELPNPNHIDFYTDTAFNLIIDKPPEDPKGYDGSFFVV